MPKQQQHRVRPCVVAERYTSLRCYVKHGTERSTAAKYLVKPKQWKNSFVMRPHPNHFHSAPIFKDLIDETMLDIDAARIRSGQITDKLFISWGSLEGVDFKNLKQLFSFWLQSNGYKFLCIFLRLLGENKRPLYQESSGEHFSTGVLSPRIIDSRILGIESRYNVSWIARQSSTETKTPAFFFPTIWIGSWDFSDSARSSEILIFVAVTVLMHLPSGDLDPIYSFI